MDFQVSVVIPVYNAERYVSRAVQSAHDLPDVGEIILIDDAGPDNSISVCLGLEQEYPKVRLLQHADKKNHGAGASRNLGILNARFPFIAFLDADDYYLPNRFEKERTIFKEDPKADGVYGALGIEYESERAKCRFQDAGFEYQEFLTLSGLVPPEKLVEVLFHSHPEVTGEFSTDTITVRSKLFERSGLFNEELKLLQDIHLWRRMASVGRLIAGNIEEPIAIRGVHDSNRMLNSEERTRYQDRWWEDLSHWYKVTKGIRGNAKRAFNRAYCNYRISHRSNWEGRWAYLRYILTNPSVFLEANGFFDLNLFNTFGRNWFTLHLTSSKNKTLNYFQSRESSSS